MLTLSEEQKVKLGLELATKRREHSDLDAAIQTLDQSRQADPMVTMRMKKHKLQIKDRIVEIEKLLLPDIIA